MSVVILERKQAATTGCQLSQTNSMKTLADAMKKMSERSYKEQSEDIMQYQIDVMRKAVLTPRTAF